MEIAADWAYFQVLFLGVLVALAAVVTVMWALGACEQRSSYCLKKVRPQTPRTCVATYCTAVRTRGANTAAATAKSSGASFN